MKSHALGRPQGSLRRQQQGAVLVISLLLLLIMTLLGLGASQSTRLQERMAGNQRDVEVALQSAEAGLRAAEELLRPQVDVYTCTFETKSESCSAYEMNTLVADGRRLDLARQSSQWWQEWSDIPDFSANLASVSPPQFVSERIAEVRDTLSIGGPAPVPVRDFYRSTARSSGTTDTAEVVVESTFARLSFE